VLDEIDGAKHDVGGAEAHYGARQIAVFADQRCSCCGDGGAQNGRNRVTPALRFMRAASCIVLVRLL
jgi:hypothetical protein